MKLSSLFLGISVLAVFSLSIAAQDVSDAVPRRVSPIPIELHDDQGAHQNEGEDELRPQPAPTSDPSSFSTSKIKRLEPVRDFQLRVMEPHATLDPRQVDASQTHIAPEGKLRSRVQQDVDINVCGWVHGHSFSFAFFKLLSISHQCDKASMYCYCDSYLIRFELMYLYQDRLLCILLLCYEYSLHPSELLFLLGYCMFRLAHVRTVYYPFLRRFIDVIHPRI